mgnify:FL=1
MLIRAEFLTMRKMLIISVIFSMTFSIAYASPNIDIPSDAVKAIELPQKTGKLRIVSLANGAAEIISALGFRKSLVGRDIASTTTELRSVPIVTSGHQLIAEKVISLKPDLVVIDAGTGPKSAIQTLKSANLKVATIPEAWNLQDMYMKVSAIAGLLSAKAEGKQLTALMKSSVSASKESIGWKPNVLFMYLRGPSSIYLIGGPGSGADSLISAIGGVDVGAKTLKNPFNTLTSEALIKANPDVILVMTKGLQSVGGVSGLLKLPGVKQTNAGKRIRIMSADDSLLLSFGPRTPSLLAKLADGLKSLK